MKKIPKSISRIIDRRKDGNLVLRCDHDRMSLIKFTKSFFRGKVPGTPYRVTYTINPRGAYDCEDSGGVEIILTRRSDGISGMAICFSYPSWHGLRVSRRVEKVKK